jgi:hypothetical protein
MRFGNKTRCGVENRQKRTLCLEHKLLYPLTYLDVDKFYFFRSLDPS